MLIILIPIYKTNINLIKFFFNILLFILLCAIYIMLTELLSDSLVSNSYYVTLLLFFVNQDQLIPTLGNVLKIV